MDIIYTKVTGGERRAHIEITQSDVADMLDDLDGSPDLFDAFASTRNFIDILHTLRGKFRQADKSDAHEAQTSRT